MNKRVVALIMTVVSICLLLSLVLEKESPPEESVGNMETLKHESEIDVNEDENRDKIAPDFRLKKLDGQETSLSDYEDKIVFLNFWASWCGYCDQEMPAFEKLIAENDDVVVLAVNVREDKKTVEKFIEDGEFSFPVLLDDSGKIGMDYVVGELPTTYIIDKDGKIVDNINGMMDYDQMNMIIAAVKDLD